MQLSQFIAFLEFGKKKVLFNTKNGVILPLPESLDIAEQSVIDISCFPKKLYYSLYRKGFLVEDTDKERDEYREKIFRYKKMPSVLIYTFIPTLDCNLSCKDCPYLNIDSSLKMSNSTADKVVDFTNHLFEKYKYTGLILWLHGGEPFTCAPICKKVIERLRTLCTDYKVPFYCIAATNGTLTKSKRQLELIDSIDYFYISISQSRDAQHYQRSYRDDRFHNSYDATLGGIARVVKHNKQIELRINVSEIERLRDDLKIICNDILEVLGGSVYQNLSLSIFHYVDRDSLCNHTTCQDSISGKNEYNTYIDKESLREISPWEIKNLDMGENNHMLNIPFIYSGNDHCCGLEMCEYLKGSRFVIMPDGSLQFCHSYLDNLENIVGNVNDPSLLFSNGFYRKLLDFDLFTDDNCRDCRYLPLCVTSCPLPVIHSTHPTLFHSECKSRKHKKIKDCVRNVLNREGILQYG